MSYLSVALLLVGILTTTVGAMWWGQGTGRIPYAADNLLLESPAWAWRGLITATFGVLLFILSWHF